jgi:hypothetical protein
MKRTTLKLMGSLRESGGRSEHTEQHDTNGEGPATTNPVLDSVPEP